MEFSMVVAVDRGVPWEVVYVRTGIARESARTCRGLGTARSPSLRVDECMLLKRTCCVLVRGTVVVVSMSVLARDLDVYRVRDCSAARNVMAISAGIGQDVLVRATRSLQSSGARRVSRGEGRVQGQRRLVLREVVSGVCHRTYCFVEAVARILPVVQVLHRCALVDMGSVQRPVYLQRNSFAGCLREQAQ